MADNDVKITITINGETTELKAAKADVEDLAKNVKKADTATAGLKDSFAALALKIGGVAALTAAFKDLVSTGFEANKSFENLQIQLTGLIAANSSNVSSMGRVLDAHEKWNLGMAESEKILNQLNETNAKTKFTLEEITGAFNMFYATSAGQGSREKAVQAMDSIALAAQAVGKNINDLTPMMDSLATGTVIAASEMGSFMKIVGLTNDELKKANENGQVYDYLIEKLAKFKELSGEAGNSYEVALGGVKNEITEIARELTKPMFETVTKGLNDFGKLIKDHKDDIIEFGEDVFRSFQLIGSGILYIGVTAAKVLLAIPTAILSGFDALTLIIENKVNTVIKNAQEAYNSIAWLWDGETTFGRVNFATNASSGIMDAYRSVEETQAKAAQAAKDLFNEIKENTRAAAKETKAATKEVGESLQSLPPKIEPVAKAAKKASKDMSSYNNALREIARLGMSEYEKKLDDIEHKEKEWLKVGIDKKTAAKAKAKLFDTLETEEANKVLKEHSSFLKEREELEKRYYEAIGEYEKAWAIESKKVKETIKKLNLSEEDAKKYLEIQKKKYFEPLTKTAKTAFSDIKNSWADTVSTMSKTVEDGFFDFFIGKTKSLKKALKDIGTNLMRDLISPYARTLAQGIAGGFGSFLGGGSNLAQIAADLGLKKNDRGGFSGQVGGTDVELSSTGQILRGASALDKGTTNLLSSISNLKTAYDTFTKGFGSPFSSIGGYLMNNGWTSSGAFFNGMGGGVNSLFGTNSMLSGTAGRGAVQAALSGYGSPYYSAGAATGGALVGGAVGYGIGSGLDKMFGANTYAPQTGMVAGAAVGGYAALAGSLSAVPVWGWIAAAVVLAIGGMIGKSKITDWGYQVGENLNLGLMKGLDSKDVNNWKEKTKKSWFSKSTSNQTSPIDSETVKMLSSYVRTTSTLLKEFTGGDFTLPARTYNKRTLIDEGFGGALIAGVMGRKFDKALSFGGSEGELEKTYRYWMEQAKKDKKETYELLAEYVGKVNSNIKALKLESLSSELEKIKFAKDEAIDALKTLNSGLGALNNDFDFVGQDMAKQIEKAYREALKSDFSKESVDRHQALTQAYKQAKKAQDDYKKAIISFSQQIAQTQSSFYQAVGGDTTILALQNIYTKFRVLSGTLANDIGKEHLNEVSKLGSTSDPKVWAEYFFRMSYAQMQEFLSQGNTELRKEFLNLITEHKNLLTANSGNEVWLKSLTGLQGVMKQIEALKLAEKAQSTLEIQKQQLNNLNLQKSAIEKLASMATKIRETVIDNTTSQINYMLALQRARAAYASGEYDSKAYDELNSAITKQQQYLKDTSATYADYHHSMLKMANEVEGVAKGASLQDISEQIKRLDKLLNNANNSFESQLAALNEQKKQLEIDAQNQINTLWKLLGEGSPIAAYLQAVKDAILSGKQAPSYSGGTGSISNIASSATTANGALLTNQLEKDINSIYLSSIGRSVEQAGLDAWVAKARAENLSKEQLKAQIEQTAKNITGSNNKSDWLEWSKKRGYKAFADGGIVTRPTRALIGEAGYDEAVIPLKDGRGVKVDMDGAIGALTVITERIEKLVTNIERNLREVNMRQRESNDNGAQLVRVVS
jgi:hypothetical protein cfetvA_16930|nr:MAG TPA: major prion protein [Caudoviricetes sp.]